tara:strand:+ start:713 stop:988 length:276 start_codon:yes stop_codon:yes gene_type:complete
MEHYLVIWDDADEVTQTDIILSGVIDSALASHPDLEMSELSTRSILELAIEYINFDTPRDQITIRQLFRAKGEKVELDELDIQEAKLKYRR